MSVHLKKISSLENETILLKMTRYPAQCYNTDKTQSQRAEGSAGVEQMGYFPHFCAAAPMAGPAFARSSSFITGQTSISACSHKNKGSAFAASSDASSIFKMIYIP